GATLAWREWVELVAGLTRWEVRLAGAHEPGLSEALRALQQSLRHDFSEFFRRHYPKWLANPEGDRPPLSVDVGAEFLVPVLQAPGGGGGGGGAGGRGRFVGMGCLGRDRGEGRGGRGRRRLAVGEPHASSSAPPPPPFP